MTVRISTATRDAIANAIDTTYANCVIRLYSGTMPASADAAETGTHLATISLAGGAFTGGATTNGLNFDSSVSGVISKPTLAEWKGTGLDNGVVGWGRLYDNAYTTGSSTTADRIDFNVATSGAPMTMATTTVSTGGAVTVDTATITMPAS